MIASLLLGWRYTRLAYRWGAGAVAAYVVSAALITGIGHIQARAWVKEEGIIMPSPFSPLHRRGMVVSDKKVFWTPISLFQGVYGDVVEYVNARSDERLVEMWASKSGMIYGWFVRVPVVQEIEGDGDFLLVQDLQFMPRPEGLGWLGLWAAHLVLDDQFGVFKRTNFALEIELDDLNNVRKIIYLGQNGERHPL